MSPSVVTSLRDLVPLRPLRFSEAMRIADLQAERFLRLTAVTEPAVPERIITELPRMRVTRMSPFPTSGASHWYQGQWLVVVNAAEPVTRQRFSLAHEFKHIIDHRFAHLIYSQFHERDRTAKIEQLCDYFAGCLLMPRPWVKRLYCSGLQHPADLAETFGVSLAAMTVRLNQIGLIEPAPRCLPLPKELTIKSIEGAAQKMRYFRQSIRLAT